MGTDALRFRGLSRRLLLPSLGTACLAGCLLYWQSVSTTYEDIDSMADASGEAGARALAREFSAVTDLRDAPALFRALNVPRSERGDVASSALFSAEGSLVATSDPYYFQSFPAQAFKGSRSLRIIRHNGFDAFVEPVTAEDGSAAGYAAVRVSRERLKRLALRSLKGSLYTIAGLLCALLLGFHLLLRKIERFGESLDRLVDEKTSALRNANTELAAEAERMRLTQKELASARDEALQAARIKAEFLANMSHEIRTPLNGVIGMSELLLTHELAPQADDCARTIKDAGETLLRVVNEILDFSKIEAGRIDFEALPFSARVQIEEVAELMAVTARSKGLDIYCSFSADIPERLIGDAHRIRQILTNLVGNAVKFTRSGEICISASWAEGGDGRGILSVDVLDSGPGIPAAALSNLFVPFAQADSSTSRRFGGTGLGLAISSRLASGMGGNLRAENRHEGGARLSLSLPLAHAARPALPSARRGPRVRVLIVEEHDGVRAALASEFADLGCVVESYRGPRRDPSLMARIQAAPSFDAALIDWSALDLDGMRLAEILPSSPALLKARIGISAYAADGPLAPKAGEWVLKPVRSAALLKLTGAAAARTTQTPPAAAARGRAARNALRILVCDDIPVNLRIAAAQLTSLGHQVVTASDGHEALAALRAGGLDLALLDCQMPTMDGYTVAAEFRRLEPTGERLPLVAMTAHLRDDERRRCLTAGMDDYLCKPVTREPLGMLISSWTRFLDDVVLERVGLGVGGMAPALAMAQEFIASLPARLEAGRRAARSGDIAELARLAHAVRGGAAPFGFSRLAATAHEVEWLAKQGLPEQAGAVFAALASVVARSARELGSAGLSAAGGETGQ